MNYTVRGDISKTTVNGKCVAHDIQNGRIECQATIVKSSATPAQSPPPWTTSRAGRRERGGLQRPLAPEGAVGADALLTRFALRASAASFCRRSHSSHAFRSISPSHPGKRLGWIVSQWPENPGLAPSSPSSAMFSPLAVDVPPFKRTSPSLLDHRTSRQKGFAIALQGYASG